MATRHILGMAKSNLDLKGAKAQKLELDYLRLVYCVKELRRNGDEAQGYLMVMNNAIEQRVNAWREKYEADDTVSVHVAPMEQHELEEIQAEKEANLRGMVDGVTRGDAAHQSDASTGHAFGELHLEDVIEHAESEIDRKVVESEFPFRIRWDYYGEIETA